MAALLGIDIGTTGAKALLIDEQGEILAIATTEYAMRVPRPHWSEQDPDDWWDASIASIRHVVDRAGLEPADIAAVGLTGQMHGLITLDEHQRPVRPCIMWNDQRAIRECGDIDLRIGHEKLIEIAGKPAIPNFTAPKLLWLRANEPDCHRRIRHLFLTKDYIRLQLTGQLATDVNDASGTLLFNVGQRRWSRALTDALGVAHDWLPDVLESPSVAGSVTSEAARATGLAEGTPVVVGCGDQAADAVGLGAISAGQTSVTIGTSGVVFTSFDSYRAHREGQLHAYCHAHPGAWHLMGVMLSAGGSLRWFRDELGTEAQRRADAESRDVYDVLVEEAQAAPPGCEGLVFLPYLAGERTPHKDPRARGAFMGLTLRHTRSHMARAVLEGVTFGLLDSVRLMRDLEVDITEIRASGGGARSRFWRQLMADVFGAEVLTLNVTQGAAFGAALLAGVGAGVFLDVPDAVNRTVRECDRLLPGSGADAYARPYEIYRALYPALATAMHKLSNHAEA